MTPAQIQEYRDGYNYSYQLGLYLDADAVHGLDIALLPSVRNALMNWQLTWSVRCHSYNQSNRQYS